MTDVITCQGLFHSYGEKPVLHGLDFRVEEGGILGLLGKNGAGKSTTINILMGFLAPMAGECRVLGHPSHAIPPAVRRDIGLLHEGFIQYDFMTIEQIERFHAPFYPRWDRDVFYGMVNRLNVPHHRRISRLSCGQRSQVVLGLIMAQSPRLMILDDYSMGLDVGYRRLFLDFLRDYVKERKTTVLLTSHVVQELDGLIDRMIVLQRGRVVSACDCKAFTRTFRHYRLNRNEPTEALCPDDAILNIERDRKTISLFSTLPFDAMATYLAKHGIAASGMEDVPMSFEDAFVGLTGRY